MKFRTPHWLILGVIIAIAVTAAFGVVTIPWVTWLLAILVVMAGAYVYYDFNKKKKS